MTHKKPRTKLRTATILLTAALGATGCTDDVSDPQAAVDGDDAQKVELSAVFGPHCNQQAHDGHERCVPSSLRTDIAWYGSNRETLTGWLDSAGCASPGYRENRKPVALFDWDNTIIKNDVGDAVTFHAIAHDQVRQPPHQNWKATSKFMTDAAATALTTACGTSVPAGEPLRTSVNVACADEMLSIYIDGKTTGGAAAFANWNFRRMEPTYAWTPQLLAGLTHAEVKQLTLDAVLPQLVAPIGTTQTIGTHTGLNGWLRLYDQQRDLIKAAQTRGYDVWVITASPQDVVGALAPLVGIPANRVIGIRSLTDSLDRLTYSFEGCGTIPDGEDAMISYIEGKRCWVNKIVFHDHSPNAINRRPIGSRQTFAAGDSDTDIEFLRDAKYKFVLNRNKSELMCFAYRNEHDSWRVNPMFISPKSEKTSPYPCDTTACKDASGVGQPCIDEGGLVIPPQLDTVHP